MSSIGERIERLHGLLGKQDLTRWEERFVADVYRASWQAQRTSVLSERQVQVVERIYSKHCGD